MPDNLFKQVQSKRKEFYESLSLSKQNIAEMIHLEAYTDNYLASLNRKVNEQEKELKELRYLIENPKLGYIKKLLKRWKGLF